MFGVLVLPVSGVKTYKNIVMNYSGNDVSAAYTLAVSIVMAIIFITETRIHSYKMFCNKDMKHLYIAFVSREVTIAQQTR
jgi:hypothetical protein